VTVRTQIGIVVVAAAVVALVGCGGNNSAQPTKKAGGKVIKVGLVTDSNQLNDHGFNQLAYQGMLRAERVLGVKGVVYESRSRSEYIPNLASLAQQRYDLIIGVGFDQADAVDEVAMQYPHTHFAIVDVDQTSLKHRPKNVVGLLFREQEVGYLVGYLAGLEAKRAPGPDVIGSVGGQKQPPVDRFIAGYQAGAKKADPRVKLLNDYSQDWVDQTKCKTLALNQIDAGSTIEFQVAGGCGLGTLRAAGERHVWGIGVDADQSFIGPQVLTSAVKRVDEAVFRTIKAVDNRTFTGGHNAVFGLKDDGVGLGKVSPRVPRADVAKVQNVRREIVAGKVKIPTGVG
jgi:basic membrane protein A